MDDLTKIYWWNLSLIAPLIENFVGELICHGRLQHLLFYLQLAPRLVRLRSSLQLGAIAALCLL